MPPASGTPDVCSWNSAVQLLHQGGGESKEEDFWLHILAGSVCCESSSTPQQRLESRTQY